MTCKEMGGPCDHIIQGNTPEEMVDNGMKHLQKDHPEMAEGMKTMSKEEGDKWMADFKAKWAKTPEM